MLKVFATLGFAVLAAATPLWQPHLFHASVGRNIRHLPCVSRRSGETGICMFAFSCAKANGTHLGTCIDRFYFGSCCKMPSEEGPPEIDVVPPIEDNSLDGSTTSQIRPAVTQKPLSSTSFSPSRPSSTSGPSSTAGPSSMPPSTASPPLTKPTVPTPTLVTWTTVEGSSVRPSVSPSIRPQVSESSAGTHRPILGSSTSIKPDASSTENPSTARPSGTTSQRPSSVKPTVTQRPSSSERPVTQGASSSPPVSSPQVWTTRPTPSIAPVSSQRPPISTHRPVSVVTLSPGVGSQSTPEVGYQPVSTQRPLPPTIRPSYNESQASSVYPPSSFSSSTFRPPSTHPSSSSRPPSSSSKPPSSSSRPPPSTAHPPLSSARPPPNTAKPPSNTAKPPSSTAKPPQGTQKPSGPRPPVTSPKPKPTQRPTSKPGIKPKPTPKPKPTVKPTTATRPTVRPTAAPNKTTTNQKPISSSTTQKPISSSTNQKPISSSTTQKPTSETWVPVSLSTHAPTTTLPSDKTSTTTTRSPSTISSSGPTTATSITTTGPPFTQQHLNMSNYKEVCGRRLFPESRVVGGDKSTFGKWPWQISLRQWRTSTYLHKCGAALLNENWAITAAHCVENVPPSDLLLRLGEHDLSIEDEPYGYQERRVQIVASHPQFDPRTFEYDLALLRFYEPVTFQPNIIPICVPDDDINFVGSTAFVTGWGRLYEDGPLPSVLQEVSVPVINNSLCETMYRAAGYIEHIPDIFICAGWKKGGFDSCEGDSGGPMVIQRPDRRWLLAGVISWGIGCAEPNQPGVYTRISQFRDWINQILQF